MTASGRTVKWAPPGNMRRVVRASGYRGNAEGVITVLVVDVILGAAVLVFLIYRQLSVRPVNASALRLIAVLLVIGLLQTYRFLSQHHAHPVTFAALGGSLVLAAIFGALRARTVRVWLDDGQARSQGNWLTAVLWIASLAAHLGYDILVGHGNASGALESPPSFVSGHQPGLPAGLGDAACPQAAARRTCSSGRAGWHRLEDIAQRWPASQRHPANIPSSVCHSWSARLDGPEPPTFRSIDRWSMSGQCAGIRIRSSASCRVSGIDAMVQHRPVSP